MTGQAVRFTSHSPDIELTDLAPHQPAVAGSDIDDDDIYRGEPSFLKDDATSVTTSSSGSSSSSSERHGGRFAMITAVVDLAISRWARGVRRGSSSSSISTTSSSTSSSSSSSASSRSSVNTLARARRRLRRRRSSSQTSLLTIQSERDIVARISRLKALEESRQVARQFALYLPSSLAPPRADVLAVPNPDAEDARQRILSTTSLSRVLGQLEIVTKRTRSRRPRGRSRGPPNAQANASRHGYQFHTDSLAGGFRPASSFDPSTAKKPKKGKARASAALSSKNTPVVPKQRLMPKAWFLDVASPTWADLRALGKLLHLHPLTLEDILQKDPREKLEVFPKLGYYFVSFRAIESKAEREKILKELQNNSDNDSEQPEVPIGEANVYLAVFNEGICCFHYRDISEHVDRVRNRISLLDDVVNMSSDWIAHGILDSVVDAFFPVLSEIEKEVMAIDKMVYVEEDEDNDSSVRLEQQSSWTSSSATAKACPEADAAASTKSSSPQLPSSYEKPKLEAANSTEESIRPHFARPRLTPRLVFRRFRRSIARFWARLWLRKPEAIRVNPRTLTLRRMAKTRKLVTLLGRLLASKADVVTQIRKRLLQTGEPSLGNGGTKGEELEVAIYMGDVQGMPWPLQLEFAFV
ncbi:hypothetical protein D9611_006759 [Ephemerocybe angulata]|uniref:Uncharacterized protein n=1 Tax=Ephemerocybe angulata TaxID=980116 RepID=A0A8H5B0C1_9AGAR|nr:hypothetical protein D9611_006759 [Tulosesus angulatus]